MTDLILYGSGDLGRVYAWYIEEINKAGGEFNILGFLDDGECTETKVAGYKFLGGKEYFESHKQPVSCVVSVADPTVCKKISDFLSSLGFVSFPNIIFPGTTIYPGTVMGKGVVISPGAVIDRDVVIGDFVKVSQLSSINHDAVLNDYAFIATSASVAGHVVVGSSSFVGMGANILPCLSIGENCTVGAGSVVLTDIAPNTTVAGVPAKPIRKRSRNV